MEKEQESKCWDAYQSLAFRVGSRVRLHENYDGSRKTRIITEMTEGCEVDGGLCVSTDDGLKVSVAWLKEVVEF